MELFVPPDFFSFGFIAVFLLRHFSWGVINLNEWIWALLWICIKLGKYVKQVPTYYAVVCLGKSDLWPFQLKMAPGLFFAPRNIHTNFGCHGIARNFNWGAPSPFPPLPFPFCFFLFYPSPPFPCPPFPPLALEVGPPKIQLEGLGWKS